MSKWEVNFTVRGGGFGKQVFETRAQAKKFIEDMDLYWHQLVSTDPRSLGPRYFIKTIPEGYEEFSGTLVSFYETGMECHGLVLSREDVPGTPNPSFDPAKPESVDNPSHYQSLESLVLIQDGDILLIDEDLVGMVTDRDFGKMDGFRLSFYPSGFSKDEWLSLFDVTNAKAKLYRKKKDEQ